MGNSGAFFRAIPVPVHKELEAPPSAACVHDPVNGIDLLSVNDPGRRQRNGGRTQGTGGHRLDLRIRIGAEAKQSFREQKASVAAGVH